MTDERLIQTYMTGMFILSLLDEWSKLERIGIVAKIYNTITAKHNVFHKQYLDAEKGRKKKYSKKCELFIRGSAYAIIAWERVIKETDGISLASNTTMHNLFRLNADDFTRIYGLQEEDFKKLDSNNLHGLVFQSCKVANLLNKESVKLIHKNAGAKNIYKLLYGDKK